MNYQFYKKDEDEQPVQAENEPEISVVKLSEQIDYLLSKENSKELTILKEGLKKYKQELDDKLKKNIPIEHERFKTFLYTNLERLLLNVIYIPYKEIRDDRLRALFRWYNEKLNNFKSLDKISHRTDKNIDEIYRAEDIPSDEIVVKDEIYEMEEFKKHRTIIPGLEPPRDRLKDFKCKKVNPPKKFRKDERVLDNLRFDLDRFKGRVGSANSSISLKSTFYGTRTGQKWFSNSGIGVTEQLAPINPRKEIKSAYGYNRPEYDFPMLVIEKEIIKDKNKQLAEKRNQEEMKKYLEEFGKAKAIYKEEIERKHIHKNIIKACEKTFKVDKDVYDDNDEQNEEDKENNNEDILDEVEENNYIDSDIDDIDNDNKKYPNINTNHNNTVMYTKILNLPCLQEALKLKQQPSQKRLDFVNPPPKKTDFTVQLHADRELLIKNIQNKKETDGHIKPDTFSLTTVNDKILQARLQSAKVCNVKEIDNIKLGYTHHYNPLSAYDHMNYQKYGDEIPKPKPKLQRPKTASEFALRNYEKYSNNLLGLREKMNDFKMEEVEKMTEMIFNGEGCEKQIVSMNEATIIPMINGGKTNYYYPRPATCLLRKPPDIPGKKKKKGKGKKKKF